MVHAYFIILLSAKLQNYWYCLERTLKYRIRVTQASHTGMFLTLLEVFKMGDCVYHIR